LRALIILISMAVVLFLSGCGSVFGNSSRGGGVYTAPQYNERVRTQSSSRKVYTARINVTGDTSYIDRKYFKQTFNEALYRNGIVSDYNSPNVIDIRIIKSVEDSKTSGGDSYQNCSAYKLDRKAQGAVIYNIKGKGYYTNSINYKFLVKSASCVSYDDAELKARKKLFRRLGEITASRVVNLKSKLRKNGAGCRR